MSDKLTFSCDHPDSKLQLTPQRLVKACRILLGWSQTTLAEKSGVSISSIARFEAGAGISIESMGKFVECFADNGILFLKDEESSIIVGVQFS